MKEIFDDNFFEFTREYWQKYYKEPLSDDDVNEIINNFENFIITINSKKEV